MKLNKKYVIFFDLDGTLVKEGTFEIDEKTIKELVRLRKKGVILCISTGRAPKATIQLNGAKLFTYYSCLLGNIIMKSDDINNRIVINQPNIKETKDFVEYLLANNYEWTYKDDWNEKTISNNNYTINRFCANHITIEELYDDLDKGKVFQILVDCELPKEIINKYNYFNFYSQPSKYYDITSKNNNKGNSINYIKKLYPDCVTIAFGDSNNDIEMFKSVDISIAMGNAQDSVKNKATYITKDVSDGGIIYAIKNILKL